MNNKFLSQNFEKILWLTSSLLIVISIGTFYDSQWTTFKLLVAAAITLYFVWFLFHIGKEEQASTIFCYLLLMLLLVANWINSGLRDTSLLLLPAIYFFAAQTIKRIHFRVIYLISSLYILCLALESYYGARQYNFSSGLITESITTGAEVFIFISLSAYLAELQFKHQEYRN